MASFVYPYVSDMRFGHDDWIDLQLPQPRIPNRMELSACLTVTVLTDHALQQLSGAQKAEATHHTALSISV